MSIFHNLFYKPVPSAEADAASDGYLPVLKDLEKFELATGHISLPSSKLCIKRKKMPFTVKLLLLALIALVLISRQTLINYASLGYDAIVRSSETSRHVACNPKHNSDQPISVAGPPDTDPSLGAKLLQRKVWKATCSSVKDAENDCRNAIDDEEGPKSDWRSQDDPSDHGHWIEIDLQQSHNLHSIAVRPSLDLRSDKGGSVRRHRVEIATKKGEWELVAGGTWREDIDTGAIAIQHATFEPRPARYVRLSIIDSAQGKKFVAISDINVYAVDTIPPSPKNGGRWSVTLDFPIVPVTAWLNPTTHKLITMASFKRDNFQEGVAKYTYAATWDPETGRIDEEKLDQTGHDMFCPGTSFDEQGRVIVTGGSSPAAFSIYDSATNQWSTPRNATTKEPMRLQIPRGYQGQTYLANGKTFMIGGTWSGNQNGDNEKDGNRDGEIFDPQTGSWTVLPNIKSTFIKMDTSQSCGDDRPDKGRGPCKMTEWRQHHPWLFSWKKDSIFHAGPSKKMNWFFTTPRDGEVKEAGFRRDKDTGFADGDAVCGFTSMYDAENGIILVGGGAPNYHYWHDAEKRGPNFGHRSEATNNAFEIKLGNAEPGSIINPKAVASMKYQRIFANAVVLPNGETLVVGGQRQGEPFYDQTWQAVPEIYSPETKTWREVARHSIPRVYHSWAMLLPDATVLVGGGGLHEKETDHYDAQIYHPSYLFKSDDKTPVEQPKLEVIDQKPYHVGDKITITSDVEVDAASLIRYSAATHTLNNDVRRIKLSPVSEGKASDKKYSVKIPGDPGVALPGYWMLFVLHKGVPSHAATVQILVAK